MPAEMDLLNRTGFVGGTESQSDEVGTESVKNKLFGIRPDAVSSIFFRFGGSRRWNGAVVLSYRDNDRIVSTSKGLAVEKEGDILTDACVIVEPWNSNRLIPGTVPVEDETALAVAVLQTDSYTNSRLPYEQRAELQHRYGVVPLDPEHVLFQGRLRDAQEGELSEGETDQLVFEYSPVDILTGEPIPTGQQIQQREHARNFLLMPHPVDNNVTPMEKLISFGR